MKKPIIVAAMLVATLGVGCKIEPHTGMPVWDDPATSEVGISTYPPHYPGPLVSDYPKPPPLGALDPETGKSRPWSSWFRSEVHTTESKFAHAMETHGAR